MQRWPLAFLLLTVLVCNVAAPAAADDKAVCTQGSGDERIAACSRIIAAGGQGSDAALTYRNRGLAYYDKRQFDRAIQDYDQAIRLDTRDAVAFNNRGIAYRAKGDPDRAIQDYNEAVRLNPKYAVAFNNRGFAYRIKGDNDRAIEDYGEAIRLNPNYGLAYSNRCYAHYAKSDYDSAIQDCDQAIKLNATNINAYFTRGLAYFYKRDYDRAIFSYDQALRLSPSYQDVLVARGLAHRAKGNFARAIQDYNEAIRLEPKDPIAFNNRGLAHFDNRDSDRAMQDYDEAIRLDPKYAAAFSNRGAAYESKGDTARALTDFRSALSLDGGSTTARSGVDRLQQRTAAATDAKPPTSPPASSSQQTASRPPAASSGGTAAPADPRAGGASQAPTGPGIALVIGNAKYPDGDASLRSPVRDARALADELKRNGFDVDVRQDLTKVGMDAALKAFYAKIKPNSSALIFFSGYGLQVNRSAYLIPVDAQIWSEAEIRRDGFDFESILDEMNRKGARVKIAIVDASRRNPYERRFRRVAAGLAPVTGPPGTLVMYAAAPNTVIPEKSDGSVFIDTLLKEFKEMNAARTVMEIFSRTRTIVRGASNGEQVPWLSDLVGEDLNVRQSQPR